LDDKTSREISTAAAAYEAIPMPKCPQGLDMAPVRDCLATASPCNPADFPGLLGAVNALRPALFDAVLALDRFVAALAGPTLCTPLFALRHVGLCGEGVTAEVAAAQLVGDLPRQHEIRT